VVLSVFLMVMITFRVSRRRREMYCGHSRLCVCVSICLSATVRPHYCTDHDVTYGSGRGCPLVVHYWADLQSGHGLRCYGNITRTRNVSEYMLVLALCLVYHSFYVRGFMDVVTCQSTDLSFLLAVYLYFIYSRPME